MRFITDMDYVDSLAQTTYANFLVEKELKKALSILTFTYAESSRFQNEIFSKSQVTSPAEDFDVSMQYSCEPNLEEGK